MAARRGEKIGWTVGWLGGSAWVAALAAIFLIQQKWLQGAVGIVLFGLAVAGILLCSPWRHPSTPYWKLMMPPYAALTASAAWAVWSYGGLAERGFAGAHLLWILPLLIPLLTAGSRKWEDMDAAQHDAGDKEPPAAGR